jgi:hypothetical protein
MKKGLIFEKAGTPFQGVPAQINPCPCLTISPSLVKQTWRPGMA